MAAYRRAYKTHNARVAKGKMTRAEFNEWCDEAKENRALAETGGMTLCEFEKWLKK